MHKSEVKLRNVYNQSSLGSLYYFYCSISLVVLITILFHELNSSKMPSSDALMAIIAVDKSRIARNSINPSGDLL